MSITLEVPGSRAEEFRHLAWKACQRRDRALFVPCARVQNQTTLTRGTVLRFNDLSLCFDVHWDGEPEHRVWSVLGANLERIAT